MARAHLVGSMNLETTEDVFRTVAEISGDTVTRYPDGETGPRKDWIMAQLPRLAANPSLEQAPPNPNEYRRIPGFRVREGIDSGSIEFDIGYADLARDSYSLFTRLKDEGVIPPGTLFQVSMPTTIAIMWPFIVPDHRRRLMPVWERALAREAARVSDSIPHDELAMQWDVAVEFSLIENVIPGGDLPPLEELLDQIVRHSRYVPDDVESGYHLCYGDSPSEPGGHGRHFKQPEDAGKLVMVANAISRGARRPINWVHMPVPIERDDDAYFEPLADLELRPDTELYLGLVHWQDGLEGTQRRIATAAKFAPRFGVATECGMARRPRERVAELLAIQRDAVVPTAPAPAATR